MRKHLYLFVLLSVGSLKAQSIKGIVIDTDTKSPINQANIILDNNKTGSFSDKNGRFEIELTNSKSLAISHLGYLDTKYLVKENENNITIELKSSSIRLNDVAISVTKNSLSNISQPASISTLSKIQIEENVSRSLAESMIGTPGVWIQKTNHGGGSPFVRGLTGNYVLILNDGIRTNNSTFRYGPNQYFNTISPFSVQSIEVLKGAGSTLYGSDAIGGTININSKNPSFNDKALNGKIYGQLASQDMEYTGGLELSGNHKNFAFITNGSYREFGDSYAGQGAGYQSPSGYNEKDFFFKGKLKLKKNSSLIFNYQWLRQDDVPRYDQVAERGYEYFNFTLQQRQLSYLRFRKEWIDSAIKSLEITSSFQLSNEERDTKKNDSSVNKNERDDVNTFGLTSQLNALLFKSIDLVSGIDLYFDKINSSRTLEDTNSGEITLFNRGLYPDDSKAMSSAVYNTYLYKLNHWNFQLGWRYNYTLNQSKDETFGNLDQSSSSLIGNTSVGYEINNQHFYASVNSAFRAPNINDISSLGDFDYGVEVPTNDLEPETSTNLEFGYKLTGKTFDFNIAYFHSKIQNLIDRVKTEYNSDPIFNGSDVYKKANIGEAKVDGLEFGFRTKVTSNISLGGSMTYTHGENMTKNEPFRRTPPLFGDISLRYDHKNYFVIFQNLAAGKQDRLSNGDIDDHRIPTSGTPGWYVANIKTGVRFNQFNINLALNNLFNEYYRIHGSGVDGLGRHIATSINYSF